MSRAQSRDGVLEVPVIDLSLFRTGTPAQRAEVARQVDEAAATVGFMQVVGHGVADSVVEGLTEAIDAFFALELPTKSAYVAPPEINRGYTPPKAEHLAASLGVASPADLFEAFNVGVEAAQFPGLDLDPAQYAANLWPTETPAFKAAVDAWFAEAGRVARDLTAVMAVALGLEEDFFTAFGDHSIDTLRMNNYEAPGGAAELEEGQVGMGAHTDYGIVTVLWADAIKGLQILDQDGVWHDVLPAPGALLVNLGDLLARWTNDRWISTLHRVLPPTDDDGALTRRRSVAYFHDGNADAVIETLPGCGDALYPPTTVADHLAAKLGGSRANVLNEKAGREGARLLAAQ